MGIYVGGLQERAMKTELLSANGTYTEEITLTNNQAIFRFHGTSGVMDIDNISVVEITDDTDLPRINYTNFDYENGEVVPYSGEGSLLLEPQSTNFITYSEDFSNSVWGNSNEVTRTASATISPDGTLNAFSIKPTSVNSNHTLRAQNLGGFTNGAVVSASFFAKQNGYKYISVVGGFGSSNTPSVIFNLEDGLIESGDGTIENYGNGWYRCITPITLNSTVLYCVATILNDNLLGSFSGDNIKGVYVYGFQVEEQSYATSYIPTQGSAVTRLADICNNSGSSDLINSTEGVLYFEGSDFDTSYNSGICISDLTYDNRVLFYFDSSGNVRAIIFANGIQLNYTTTGLDYTINHKYAIAWKNNDMRFFVDGVMLHSQATGNAPTGMNNLSFTSATAISDKFRGNVKSVAVFKEALSDTELQKLTQV